MSTRTGQTLLEAVLAIGVILVATTAAGTLVVATTAVGQSSTDKIAAANFAREGIEVVRGIRDSNWLKRAQNVQDGATTTQWDDDARASGQESMGTYCSAGCVAKFDPTTGWSLVSVATAINTGIYITTANPPYLTQNCTATCTLMKYSRTIVVTTMPDSFFVTSPSTDASYLRVVSTVSWQNHGSKSYTATENLYDWR